MAGRGDPTYTEEETAAWKAQANRMELYRQRTKRADLQKLHIAAIRTAIARVCEIGEAKGPMRKQDQDWITSVIAQTGELMIQAGAARVRITRKSLDEDAQPPDPPEKPSGRRSRKGGAAQEAGSGESPAGSSGEVEGE